MSFARSRAFRGVEFFMKDLTAFHETQDGFFDRFLTSGKTSVLEIYKRLDWL